MKKLSLLAIIITAAAACSQAADDKADDGTPPGPGNGNDDGKGTGTGSGTGTGTGTGTTPTPTPTTAPTPTPKEVKSGFVSLSQTTFVAGTTTINSFSALAGFAKTMATTATSDCKQSVDAECNITECNPPAPKPDAGAPDAGTPAPVKAPTAGKITVAAAQSLDLAADDKGAYAVKSGQTLLFAPGATIGVKALGDTVPAFETSLKGPASVTVTGPVWPAAGQALNLDRTKALPLVWTGGGEGNVAVTVSSVASGKLTSLSCKYASKDNKGTISAAAMGKLLVTDTGSISVSSSSTANVDKDDWKIVVMASSPAKAGTSFASGLAKIK